MESSITDIARLLQERELDFSRNLIEFFQRENFIEGVDALKQAIHFLQQPFLIVIVGEYNSGKSALINSLLGSPLVEMGATPTTDKITVITSDDVTHQLKRYENDEDIAIVKSSHERLDNLAIVDTPGTNSLIDRHQQLTEQFIPRADLILFVSSMQQPLTASEKHFLSLIHEQWQRKIIFLLNKKDLLEEADFEKVVDYSRQHLRDYFRRDIPIYTISAKQALAGRTQQNRELLEASMVPRLEEEIFDRLGNKERWNLKLKTPLITIEKYLTDRCDVYGKTIISLDEEIKGIQKIEEQSKARTSRIKELLEAYIPSIETPFYRFEHNCNQFIDREINLTNVIKMKITGKALDRLFQEEVFGDSTFREQFDRSIERASSFVLQEIYRFSHDAFSQMTSHISHYTERKRKADSVPDYSRLKLQKEFTQGEKSRYGQFDYRAESLKIQQSISSAINNFLGIEAVSGGVIALFLATALSDVTGILLGTAMAGLGFTILPRRKAKIKEEFAVRIREIASDVKESVRTGLHQEIDSSLSEFLSLMTPYISLCRTESQEYRSLREECLRFHEDFVALADDLERFQENGP